MNIIGITGSSGSGKTFFSKQLAQNLENSKAINLDHIFFGILNTDNEVINRIIQLYGKNAYDRSGYINVSALQNLENFSFEDFFNSVKDKLDEKIVQIINENEENNIDNLILEWFMLPRTVAFEKSDYSILVSPDEKDRENSLMQRDENDSPEKIKKRTQSVPINYEDYSYNMISQNTYTDGCFVPYIEYIKQRFSIRENYNIKNNQEIFTQNEIGKATINTPTLLKDEEQSIRFSEQLKVNSEKINIEK